MQVPSRPTIMDVTLVAVLLGCVQTIALRLARIRRALIAKDAHR